MQHLPSIAFLSLLGLGILGWYGLIAWPRHNPWWMRAAAVLCFFGLTGAGMWMPEALRNGAPMQRIATQPNATQRNATPLPLEAQPEIVFDSRWGPERENEYLARYEAVVAEIGPPPIPGAVPVLGYVDVNGHEYRARWRAPPNADKADNLKEYK